VGKGRHKDQFFVTLNSKYVFDEEGLIPFIFIY